MSATPTSMLVLRVTPMIVRPDITPLLKRYEALGFERVETEDPGCIGLQAGHTAVILSSVAFMNGDFAPTSISRIVDQTIAYVHVASVDQARTRFAPGATVLQDVRTRGGTRELLVEDDEGFFILAEKVA